MTNEEKEAFRELVYIAKDICRTMALNPDRTARQIAGDINDPEEELARFARAIEAAGKLVYPAWTHRHADEVQS
jgi:hypothetical protein